MFSTYLNLYNINGHFLVSSTFCPILPLTFWHLTMASSTSGCFKSSTTLRSFSFDSEDHGHQLVLNFSCPMSLGSQCAPPSSLKRLPCKFVLTSLLVIFLSLCLSSKFFSLYSPFSCFTLLVFRRSINFHQEFIVQHRHNHLQPSQASYNQTKS